MTQRQPSLKQISCPPECGFQVRSHDEAEVIDLTMRHASRMSRKYLSTWLNG